MKYLTVAVLCLLATSKVTVQGLFAKKNIKSSRDATFFNCLIFSFAALLFLWQAVKASHQIWFFGMLFGILSVVFQVYYSKALASGNTSVTVLIVNLGMVFSIAVSVLLFEESLSLMRGIGILLVFAAFFTVTDIKAFNLKGLAPALVAMLANGGLGVVQKLFGKSEWHTESTAFVSCSYIVATVASFLFYLLLARKTESEERNKKPSIFIYAAAAGLILAVFQLFNTYAISTVDGTFLFPAYSGGCIVFSTLSGVFILKDRLNLKQAIGVGIGVVALVFMNF